jgi:hypothetical protein
LGGSEGLGPGFGEIHGGGGGVEVLVFDSFGEFFLLVLEFHLESDFEIFSIGDINIGDSFEFLKIEEESPLFILGSLFAEFLELFLIVEEELLLFGLFGLDAFHSALADVHEFGEFSLDVDQCVFGFDQFEAQVAHVAQALLFHVRDVLELFGAIIQMGDQFVNQFVCHKFFHLVFGIEHTAKTAHNLAVVLRGHLDDLFISSDFPHFCLGF